MESLPAWFAMLVLCLVEALPQARATPPAQAWLPTNTIAHVTLPNAGAARNAWRSHTPGRLWSDPAMAPFRTHTASRADRVLWEPIARLTGFRADELARLAEGQVTLALLDESAPGDSPLALQQLLLLDAGTNAAPLNAWFTNRNPQVPGSTVALQGVEFIRLPMAPAALDEVLGELLPKLDETPADPAQPPKAFSLYVGIRDALLLASTSTNALTHALPRLLSPDLPAERSTTTPGGIVASGTLRIPPLLRSLSMNPLPLGGFAMPEGGPSLARIATALGFANLRQTTFAVRSGPEGWYLDFQLQVPPAARHGLFGLLPLQASESGPPPFVPADAAAFARLRVSGAASWKGLERIVHDVDPTFLGVLQMFTGYAGKTDDADFDFQKGILDLLGDDWILASVPSGKPGSFGNLLLVGSPKASELLRGVQLVASPTFLATFFPPESPALVRREHSIHGHPVTSILLPPMPWNDGATGAFHFAQRQGYVAFSSELAALTAFLGTNAPPVSLANRPGFGDHALRAGGTTGGYFAAVDEQRSAARTLAALAQSPHALSDEVPWIALSPAATRLVAGLERWIDPTLIPPFEQVAAHFGWRITSGRITANGFELTTFRPSPGKGSP